METAPLVPNVNPTATTVNPRTAWWQQHKDEPRIVECMREARRKYYYKNQAKEQERGRQYYYKRKALLAPAPVETPAE